MTVNLLIFQTRMQMDFLSCNYFFASNRYASTFWRVACQMRSGIRGMRSFTSFFLRERFLEEYVYYQRCTTVMVYVHVRKSSLPSVVRTRSTHFINFIWTKQ